ncbi:DUF5318 family protein [Amycolatopsis alkalitolerans]|uniref:DUF5318 domain-containing protein n=1 Tax=Amycolatopsis alkalitolerans TaxID=2547244 RepID=A0A5C4M4P5_9PSEU|nr:DUF5318 family protein [Amycolatopsis alkalitolerans]TNC26190.1 hypothetical protein FG385_13640 [Amycolatopsis alkalitolerans]
MQMQRHVVDYGLQRRALLADFRAGRLGRKDVCDADPYLLRAAKFHGEQTRDQCPVCLSPAMMLVSWVFGDDLKHMTGSAKSPAELTRMAGLFREFTVHQVEVCAACRWNHLVLSYVLGTGAPERTSKRTAGQ